MLWFAFEEKSFHFKHFINQVCLAVLILTENAGIIQTDMISEVIMTIFYEFFSFLFLVSSPCQSGDACDKFHLSKQSCWLIGKTSLEI